MIVRGVGIYVFSFWLARWIEGGRADSDDTAVLAAQPSDGRGGEGLALSSCLSTTYILPTGRLVRADRAGAPAWCRAVSTQTASHGTASRCRSSTATRPGPPRPRRRGATREAPSRRTTGPPGWRS